MILDIQKGKEMDNGVGVMLFIDNSFIVNDYDIEEDRQRK